MKSFKKEVNNNKSIIDLINLTKKIYNIHIFFEEVNKADVDFKTVWLEWETTMKKIGHIFEYMKEIYYDF